MESTFLSRKASHNILITLFWVLTQVTAQDKASGKTQKITITSDKGRLSEEEIERMIREAEENAETDRILRENVEAKNQLEAYLYSVRSSCNDALKDKISDDEKSTVDKSVADGLSWLEDHGAETKAVYDDKKKEVEAVVSPIITKAYQANPSSSGAGGDDEGNSGDGNGPTVEEVN